MGKRGPSARDEYEGKSRVISVRLTPETFGALEKVVANSRRSRSGEIEHRLRRSFEKDETIVSALGGPQMYALLRAVAAAMNLAGEFTVAIPDRKKRSSVSWLTDPYAYDQAVKATIRVLKELRPPGDPIPPKPPLLEEFGTPTQQPFATRSFASDIDKLGDHFASVVLDEVAGAEATLPPPNSRLTKEEALARRIASDLGPLRDHLKRRHRK